MLILRFFFHFPSSQWIIIVKFHVKDVKQEQRYSLDSAWSLELSKKSFVACQKQDQRFLKEKQRFFPKVGIPIFRDFQVLGIGIGSRDRDWSNPDFFGSRDRDRDWQPWRLDMFESMYIVQNPFFTHVSGHNSSYKLGWSKIKIFCIFGVSEKSSFIWV